MELKIVKDVLPIEAAKIEEAVLAFAREVNVHGDTKGFFDQTLSTIYGCIYRNSGDFWLAIDEDAQLVAYAIGSVSRDIDNSLCYTLTQAYIAPQYRALKQARAYWQVLKQQAKKYFCKHIIIVSGRNGQEKAYMRFLGRPYHQYATLLKEDL